MPIGEMIPERKLPETTKRKTGSPIEANPNDPKQKIVSDFGTCSTYNHH
jgi:hypothetical protein